MDEWVTFVRAVQHHPAPASAWCIGMCWKVATLNAFDFRTFRHVMRKCVSSVESSTLRGKWWSGAAAFLGNCLTKSQPAACVRAAIHAGTHIEKKRSNAKGGREEYHATN